MKEDTSGKWYLVFLIIFLIGVIGVTDSFGSTLSYNGVFTNKASQSTQVFQLSSSVQKEEVGASFLAKKFMSPDGDASRVNMNLHKELSDKVDIFLDYAYVDDKILESKTLDVGPGIGGLLLDDGYLKYKLSYAYQHRTNLINKDTSTIHSFRAKVSYDDGYLNFKWITFYKLPTEDVLTNASLKYMLSKTAGLVIKYDFNSIGGTQRYAIYPGISIDL